MPGEEALKGAPLISTAKETTPKEAQESTSLRAAQQANTLMSLISAHENLSRSPKGARVWLGEGLGSISKRVHKRMLRWEFVDMADFRPRSAYGPTHFGD